jgi:hypothetical protein
MRITWLQSSFKTLLLCRVPSCTCTRLLGVNETRLQVIARSKFVFNLSAIVFLKPKTRRRGGEAHGSCIVELILGPRKHGLESCKRDHDGVSITTEPLRPAAVFSLPFPAFRALVGETQKDLHVPSQSLFPDWCQCFLPRQFC